MNDYVSKVWIAAGITTLIVVILLVLKTAFNVLLLVLAGSLVAVYFRGLSYLLAEKTKLSRGKSLLAVIAGTVIILGLTFWLLGSKIQSQMALLGKKLPDSSQELKRELSKYELGRHLVDNLDGLQEKLSSDKALKTVQSFFKTSFGVLGDIYVILFIGIFFTANPSLYQKSIIALIPPRKRKKGEAVMASVGLTLRDWLMGKMFAMIVVTILTAIGLMVIDIPMALALAVIAGLLNFIPNFGPILAMIPAALIALSKGTTAALIVVALYIGIQVLESNAITPLVQKRLISIPPAYIIIGQVTMGVLTGGWGLVLATPFIAVLMVLIQKLYVDNLKSADVSAG